MGLNPIEDLPTLSLLLETRLSIQALQLLIWVARTSVSSALCHLLLYNLSGAQARGPSCILIVSAVVGLYHFSGDQESSAIICAVEIGRSLTVLLLASLIHQSKHSQHTIFKILCFDVILMVSLHLGCQDVDWIIVGLLHCVNTILDIWHQLGDKRKSVVRSCHSTLEGLSVANLARL